MNFAKLHEDIMKVCPTFNGLAIAEEKDFNTWTFKFGSGTSEQQKKAAKVLAEKFYKDNKSKK